MNIEIWSNGRYDGEAKEPFESLRGWPMGTGPGSQKSPYLICKPAINGGDGCYSSPVLNIYVFNMHYCFFYWYFYVYVFLNLFINYILLQTYVHIHMCVHEI